MFIGDLSQADAALISAHAKIASGILEFGVGGSTQLFAANARDIAVIVSVDTSQEWIDKTIYHLQELGCKTPVRFIKYEEFTGAGTYGLIYNDGAYNLREEFARKYWGCLHDNGRLMIHDTRRGYEASWVSRFIADHWSTISNVAINAADSNMTIITKCSEVKYSNWNVGKPKWQVDGINKPDDWVSTLRELEEG